MKIGEIIGAARGDGTKPLDGLRILAIEQMQALPFATQLLTHLGEGRVQRGISREYGPADISLAADPGPLFGRHTIITGAGDEPLAEVVEIIPPLEGRVHPEGR